MGINNLALTFLLLLAQHVIAQKSDTSIVLKNGRRFKEFTINKGQTLYSLSKATGVHQDSLIFFNRSLENGLKTGMRICIPLSVQGNSLSDNRASLRHEVKPGETIFGIARMYGLTQDELTKQNPALQSGLKIGTILSINPKPGSAVPPKPEKVEVVDKPFVNITSDCILPDSFVNKTLTISLVLPLYSKKEESQIKSRTGIEFYAGCIQALDSLKNLGFNINLNVFDTQEDSLAMNKILKSNDIKSSDFILGPLHASEFRQISNLLSRDNTLSIAPLASSSALLTGAPHVVKLIPDQKRLMEGLVEQVVNNYKNARFIFIRNSNAKDKDLTNNLASALSAKIDTTASNFVSLAYSGVNDLLEKLDSDKENILFFPSTAQVQVIDAIARLNASRMGKRITLVGLNEWNNFENIEYEHLNNLNFTYAAPWYIDYNTSEARLFRERYRSEFKGEPGVFAFQGYDAMMYFVMAAAKQTKPNTECLTKIPTYKGFCTEFKFRKENATTGADNSHVYVLQLSDYIAAPIK